MFVFGRYRSRLVPVLGPTHLGTPKRKPTMAPVARQPIAHMFPKNGYQGAPAMATNPATFASNMTPATIATGERVHCGRTDRRSVSSPLLDIDSRSYAQ